MPAALWNTLSREVTPQRPFNVGFASPWHTVSLPRELVAKIFAYIRWVQRSNQFPKPRSDATFSTSARVHDFDPAIFYPFCRLSGPCGRWGVHPCCAVLAAAVLYFKCIWYTRKAYALKWQVFGKYEEVPMFDGSDFQLHTCRKNSFHRFESSSYYYCRGQYWRYLVDTDEEGVWKQSVRTLHYVRRVRAFSTSKNMLKNCTWYIMASKGNDALLTWASQQSADCEIHTLLRTLLLFTSQSDRPP